MIFGRLKVTQKLLLMAVGVMAVIGTIVGYTIYAVQAQKSDARVIEVAGRQRMLVQQYLAQVMIVAEGGKADYRNTLRIFDETLQSVVHGGRPSTIWKPAPWSRCRGPICQASKTAWRPKRN